MKCPSLILAVLFIGLLGLGLAAAPAGGAAPERMSYQGYLEEDEQPVSGTRNLRFVLYGSPAWSDSLWSEGHPDVSVDRGVFSVQLGSVRPLTTTLLGRPAIYLETRVNGVALAPRRRLDAVPYALVSTLADSAGYAAQALNAQSAQTAVHAETADTAAYALHAAYADSAGSGGGGGDSYWGPNGSHIHNLNAGSVGIGTAAPTRRLHVIDSSANPAAAIRNNGTGIGLEVAAAASAGIGLRALAAGRAVEGWASGTGGVGVYGGADAGSGPTTGVFGIATSPNARGVYGTVDQYASGTSYGVLGEVGSSGWYGVGGRNLAETGAGVGVYGYSAALSGHGVRGEATGTLGKGVSGTSPETGVYGTASGSGGRGVHGVANSANAYGVFGSSTSTSGTGVYGTGGLYGGRFLTSASGSDRYAVLAEATAAGARAVQAVASGSGAVALYAEASDQVSTTGAAGQFVCRGGGPGVIGQATSTGTASNHGGYFTTEGSNASGVVGINRSYLSDAPGVLGEHRESDGWGVGVRGNGNYRGVEGFAYGLVSSFTRSGVYGRVEGGTAPGMNCGVYGSATGSGTNYAGYFAGNTHVTGTLSKAAGSFKIDHPLDPANKYLLHSFVESPDMMNVYNGNVVLDSRGEAVVTLPDWFEALNREFRYQLTCIGGFAPVYIADKVRGNQFRIAGGAAGLEVSWQITGVRQDPFANAHRIAVEMEKPDGERGTYLHPVERGLPLETQTDRVNDRP